MQMKWKNGIDPALFVQSFLFQYLEILQEVDSDSYMKYAMLIYKILMAKGRV